MFNAAYLRVCRGLAIAPDGDQSDECYRAVQGYPANLYDTAATRLLKSCRFLPKPSEWVEVLDSLSGEGPRSVGAWNEVLTAPICCEVCGDTGLAPVRKVVNGQPWEGVAACACRPTNRNYQRKRGRQLSDPPKSEAAALESKFRAIQGGRHDG